MVGASISGYRISFTILLLRTWDHHFSTLIFKIKRSGRDFRVVCYLIEYPVFLGQRTV